MREKPARAVEPQYRAATGYFRGQFVTRSICDYPRPL
jgi:hypothetical protein